MPEEEKKITFSQADSFILKLSELYEVDFQVTLKCKPNLKTNKVEVELVESNKLEDFQ